MQHKDAALSSDFLFARLHGIWGEMIQGAALYHLVFTGGSNALHRVLESFRIAAENRSEVQKKLNLHVIENLAQLMRLQNEPIARYYQLFIDRFFFDNLKTVLHYRYFAEHEVDIHLLLTESPQLHYLDADALLKAKDIHQFYSRLPQYPAKEKFLPVLIELNEHEDVFAAECRLDHIYYELLQEAAAGTPLSMRTKTREIVGTEIDINNIIMLLRNAQLYHLNPSEVMQHCFPQGWILTQDIRNRLEQVKSVAEIIDVLPAQYRKVLESPHEVPLYVIENKLWRQLYKLARGAFKDFNAPAKSIAVFPYLKFFEAQDLNRVFEGFHFKLDSKDIASMTIGIVHV